MGVQDLFPFATDQALPFATNSVCGVSANTVLKSGAGRLIAINVLVAGAAGAIYDSATTGAEAVTNELMVIPATVGPVTLPQGGIPFANGFAYAPGASQVATFLFQ